MIALRAIAPLHHPLNRYAVTGGALRRVLVARKQMTGFPSVEPRVKFDHEILQGRT
jgi:hypothetical protein